MKAFHFSAHGDEGNNILAREWCRKSHHYYSVWLEVGSGNAFDNAHEWVYVDSVEFTDWVATQDPGSNTWARIAELKAARPQL